MGSRLDSKGAKECKADRSRQTFSNADDEFGKVDDDDENERKDHDTDRPGHLCAGVGDAVSTQKKPKDGYRKKEAKEAAPGRRKKASAGDQGTQKQKKARVAPKRKVKPG